MTATGREFDVVARYTVGDDGAHSLIRAACDIPLKLRPFPVNFHCFGIDAWTAALPPAVARVWVNGVRRGSRIGGLFIVFFPEGRAAGLAPLRPTALEDRTGRPRCPPRRLARVRGRRFGHHPGHGRPTTSDDFVRVTPQWGHAPRATPATARSSSATRSTP